MGGGPSHWATEAHIRAGCPTYATPDAARSFNDDLTEIERMGVRVVSDDEARRLAADASVAHVELRDVDLDAIRRALAAFGVPGALDDPRVRAARNTVAINVGNFHTLAFHLDGARIARIFEHHTGLLDTAKLDGILDRFAAGRLTNQEIFADSGHGALDADP